MDESFLGFELDEEFNDLLVQKQKFEQKLKEFNELTNKLEGYDNSDIIEIETDLKNLKKLLMKISNSMNLIKNLARDDPNELKIVKKIEDIADFIEMNAETMNINFQKKINDLQNNYFFSEDKAKN